MTRDLSSNSHNFKLYTLESAGGPNGDPSVCGAMTSGGTESILTAMKVGTAWAEHHLSCDLNAHMYQREGPPVALGIMG